VSLTIVQKADDLVEAIRAGHGTCDVVYGKGIVLWTTDKNLSVEKMQAELGGVLWVKPARCPLLRLFPRCVRP
jgi:hypothetical protein